MFFAETDSVVTHLLSILGGAVAGVIALLPVLRKYRDGEAANVIASTDKSVEAYQKLFDRLHEENIRLQKECVDKQNAIDRQHQLYAEAKEEIHQWYGYALALKNTAIQLGMDSKLFPEMPEVPGKHTAAEAEFLHRTQQENFTLGKAMDDSIRREVKP